MNNTVIGHLTKITGSKITIRIVEKNCISKVDVADFSSSYVSIGTLIGVRLVDGRDLVLLVEEIYENNHDVYATAAISGIYDPAIKSCISALAAKNKQWDMRKLPNQIEEWINENTPQNQKGEKDVFSKNNISGHLRTMSLRIDSVLNDSQLMSVINTAGDEQTIDTILKSPKPVVVIDLQVSSDTLDVVLYLMFKALYERKSKRVDTTHICLVLEEAHRYINTGAEESKLGSYYIDKLAREGRKFGVGLIISSQVPSLLSYEIVSQCNSVVMHKINSKKDLEFLKNVLRVSSDNFHQQMSALEKQYAIEYPRSTMPMRVLLAQTPGGVKNSRL